MKKLKRNDTCPCGSGKKYKKCCGKSNVVEISPQLYNEELGQLHDELIAYALDNYEELFMEQTDIYFQPFFSEDSIVTEDYLTGLTMWTILHDPLLEDDQTIFDVFYNQQKGKIKRTRTRNTFLEWTNTVPSVYEIVEEVLESTEFITVIDISTNQTYQVPNVFEIEYEKGTLIVGYLVPFVGFHYFFFDMIELIEDDKQKILSFMDNYVCGDTPFIEAFPDFLAEVLLNEVDDSNESLPNDEVAHLFKEHMESKGVENKAIYMGIQLWNAYRMIEQPNFKKPATYAAALEYLIQLSILENFTITQKEIADEYGTTAGTVSTNYRKMLNFVENVAETTDLQQPVDYDPVSMERDIKDLQKILSEQEFDNAEDAEDFIHQLLESGEDIERLPMTPRDRAQDLLYDAREVQGIKRKRLIEEALEIYPYSPDAYLLLAEEADTIVEIGRLLNKAIHVGEKDLGKAFFLENKGHFWMIIETRPYMRAKAMYADFLYETGEEEEAFKQYEEMLRLNPNDNQGIRYILLTLYIETEQFKKAQELISEFSDEGTANFSFNKILVDYYTNGLTTQTKTLIKEANQQNPFVKDYLLGKKKLPAEHYTHIGIGDETEAIAYAEDHIHLWQDCLELLKKF